MHAYICARLLCNGESEGAIKSEIYEIEKLDGQLLLHVEGHISIWVSFRSRGEHLVCHKRNNIISPRERVREKGQQEAEADIQNSKKHHPASRGERSKARAPKIEGWGNEHPPPKSGL